MSHNITCHAIRHTSYTQHTTRDAHTTQPLCPCCTHAQVPAKISGASHSSDPALPHVIQHITCHTTHHMSHHMSHVTSRITHHPTPAAAFKFQTRVETPPPLPLPPRGGGFCAPIFCVAEIGEEGCACKGSKRQQQQQQQQHQHQQPTTAVQQHVISLQIAVQHALAVDELQAADDVYGDADLGDV